jgi:hypothetical protein
MEALARAKKCLTTNLKYAIIPVEREKKEHDEIS